MTDRLDDAALAAIRALCDAATPGPWEARIYDDGAFVDMPGTPAALFSDAWQAKDGDGGISVDLNSAGPVSEVNKRNIEFIAACRTAVPALLAEVERLRADAAALQQALTDPENQPSQWGTVPLALLAEPLAAIVAHWRPAHDEAFKRWEGSGTEAFEDPNWVEAANIKPLVDIARAALARAGEGGGP